jgi:7-cyano-7-deazaguanine synthase in queuosine biosynthesis
MTGKTPAVLLSVLALALAVVPAANANTTACAGDVQTRAWAFGEAAARQGGSMKRYRDAQRTFIPCAQRAFNMGLAYRYALDHEVAPLRRGDMNLPTYVRDAWNLGVYLRSR